MVIPARATATTLRRRPEFRKRKTFSEDRGNVPRYVGCFVCGKGGPFSRERAELEMNGASDVIKGTQNEAVHVIRVLGEKHTRVDFQFYRGKYPE